MTSESFRPFDSDLEPTGEEGRQARTNRRAAFRLVVELAFREEPLSAEALSDWHRQLYRGLKHVPHDCYRGGWRGSDHPWLRGYEVEIAPDLPGAPVSQVAQMLDEFLRGLENRVQQLAGRCALGSDKTRAEVWAVAELSAWAHGVWLAIHPFANGNGRMARLIANYVLARFRLAPLVALRPRPGPPYAERARASMSGDVQALAEWIVEQLQTGVASG